MRVRFRTVFGVGLLATLTLIVGNGFMASLTGDTFLSACWGFVVGLITVYVIERLSENAR